MRLSRRTSRPSRRGRRRTQNRAAPRRRRSAPLWRQRTLRIGLILFTVGALAEGGWYLWRSGWVDQRLADAGQGVMALTQMTGFSVDAVLVEGRERTDGAALLAALAVSRGTPILSVNPEAARERVEQLVWVDKASVVRQLPDTVFIRITEHKPLALWQRDGALALINVRGEVIPTKIDDFGYLPLVVGDDAAAHATQLLSLVAAFPAVADELEAAVRISGRRWNLRLKGKIEVRLPETEIAVALARLAALQQSQGLLQRDVVAVDLRLPDRLIVQTNTDEIVPAVGNGEDT